MHQDDVVRFEWDGPAGTLSCGVNGATPVVAFSNLAPDISYPCCGSYHQGVSISLLKLKSIEVEVLIPILFFKRFHHQLLGV